MVVVLALAAAVLYGSADFLGGLASRRSRALSVLAISVPAGAVVMLVPAVLSGAPPGGAGLGWAVAGGAAGGGGMIAFYAGLAAGPISVVAPVSALVSTVLPVGVALAAGERVGAVVYAGAALCLAAIVLVSMEGGAREPRGLRQRLRGVGYGAVSGVAFGMFFLALRNAGESGLYWPVSLSRMAGTGVVLTAAAWLGARPAWRRTDGRVRAAAVAAGALDALANLFYLLATRAGLFGMAVVLTSLYPGITVLLARVVLGERMRGAQRVGLVLAAAGIVLVTF